MRSSQQKFEKLGKKTVAIIGDTGVFPPALFKAAMLQDFRLLYVSRDKNVNSELKDLMEHSGKSNVEFLTCEKEGCWEADVIAFTKPAEIRAMLLDRIKKVSTQKIVLVISCSSKNQKGNPQAGFQDLLPHSKVVELVLGDTNFSIFGRNREAAQTVRNFFESAGYFQKQ